MRSPSRSLVLLTVLGLSPLGLVENALSQEPAMSLDALKELIERQGKQLEEQRQQIEELRKLVGADHTVSERRGNQTSSTPGEQQSSHAVANRKTTPEDEKPLQPKDETPSQPVGRPPEKSSVAQQYKEIEAIFAQQGVLTPKRTLVFEPSFQYSYSSSNRVVLNGYTIIPAITIGLIDVRNVNRNTYIPAFTARYGLTNRLELQVYAPYVFREDSSVESSLQVGNQNDTVFNADGNHIGDVQFGLRYQFNMPAGGKPIFIGSLQAKSDTGKDPFHVPTDQQGNQLKLPTGTGFWGIQPGLTAIFPSDPVVFFGSVNYLYNFERSYRGARWEPGNTFGFNFGMGFSMNEDTSFSIGYEHFMIGRTKKNGVTLSTSQSTTLGSLLFGASYKLSDRVNINFSLEAGLTDAAPDVQLTLRVPFSI